MNQDKFEKQIIKKYGVKSQELKDLSIKEIKKLKLINEQKFKEIDKFKIIKKTLGVISKGALIGSSISGGVNTIFPNLFPVGLTYITTNSDIPNSLKLTILTFLASKPVDSIDGYIILSMGAGIGIITYSGYTLVKNTVSTFKIKKDKKMIKKIGY